MAYHTFFTKVRGKRGKLTGMREVGSDKSVKERAKTGFEVEFLLVDKDGGVSNEADKVLLHIENKELAHEAVKECCHSYIEMGVYPRIYVRNVAAKFLEDMVGVLDIAEEYGLEFFPMAMYPYDYEPKMRESEWYGVKKKLFGDKWEYAGRCAGFHFHYSLPKGIFDYSKRNLIEHAKRGEKQKTVNCFNFGIAIDPALCTLTQSSPIFKGSYLGKDSRMLLYRGGPALGYDGLYDKYQEFGALQNYVTTYDDLDKRAKARLEGWLEIVGNAGGDLEEVKKKNVLDISWNPVKVNKVGTIELRNMDMNMPSTLMAVAILSKYVLRDIQRREIEVIPDELAIEEPFKLESAGADGGVERLYIPPFSYVNNVLQRDCAWDGMDSDALYDYVKAFYTLCSRFTNKKYTPILRPVREMVKKRATRSDEILRLVRKEGYNAREEKVPNEALKELVLFYSSKTRSDIENTIKLMNALVED